MINICDICHRTPCHPQCPNAPPLKIIGRCKYCKAPIYETDFYISDEYGYIFDKEDCLIEQYKKEGNVNNEFTRKEKPCPLSGELCDREDKDCNYCIAEEEKYQSEYTYETVAIEINNNDK